MDTQVLIDALLATGHDVYRVVAGLRVIPPNSNKHYIVEVREVPC